MGLRWSDLNWEHNALTVRSPKTAGHEAHAVRMVPIDPELRVILQDLFEQAEPGSDVMLPSHRDPDENLRTPFYRIAARAGVKPWPRLMHNMRANCATDWVERFPAHSVASWLGHSPTITATHYLQARDAHFNLAAGVEKAAANPATHMHPPVTTGAHVDYSIGARFLAKPEKSGSLVAGGVACASVQKQETPAEAGVMTPNRASKQPRLPQQIVGFPFQAAGIHLSKGTVNCGSQRATGHRPTPRLRRIAPSAPRPSSAAAPGVGMGCVQSSASNRPVREFEPEPKMYVFTPSLEMPRASL